MDNLITQASYALDFPVEIDGGVNIESVILNCPTAKSMDKVSKIDELVMKSQLEHQTSLLKSFSAEQIKDMQEMNARDPEEELVQNPKDILNQLKQTGNFHEFALSFKSLITNDKVAEAKLSNGSVSPSFGASWYEKINISDIDGLMRKYLQSFFIR